MFDFYCIYFFVLLGFFLIFGFCKYMHTILKLIFLHITRPAYYRKLRFLSTTICTWYEFRFFVKLLLCIAAWVVIFLPLQCALALIFSVVNLYKTYFLLVCLLWIIYSSFDLKEPWLTVCYQSSDLLVFQLTSVLSNWVTQRVF